MSYAFNIRQFSTVDTATKFYDDLSFGYSAVQPAATTKPSDYVYTKTMGRAPTATNGAARFENFNLLAGSIQVVIEQDEFVTWGTVSFMSS